MFEYRRLATCVLALVCCGLSAPWVTAEGPVARPLERTGPGGTSTTGKTEPTRPAAVVTTPAQEPAPAEEHPLKPAIRLAQKGLESLADVEDYTATISRRELVGNELVSENMVMKFREEPFSVYLLFGGQNAGREVLYVDGRNDNKLMAHEGSGLTSFIGTISLAPDSPQVLKQSRHMITEIGLRNMVGAIITRWEEESKYGECEVKYYQNATLNDRECLAIECTHPRPRRQFKFHISRLYLEKETGIGIRVENFGFPVQQGGKPVLIEEYTYSNLKTNVGLTDIDFDRNNPRYKF
jgi:hypothetical protein